MAAPQVIPLAQWLPASHTGPAGPGLAPECHGRAYFGIGASAAQKEVIGMTATQQAIANSLPPATALGLCSGPNRRLCREHHARFSRFGGFWVCNDCARHSRRLLGLDAAAPPAGTGAIHYFNRLRLVGPPTAPNHWVTGPWWQTAAEWATGTVINPNRFPGFLTRVCDPCERTVQQAIIAMVAGTIPACATLEQRRFWENSTNFRFTCTCKKTLGIMSLAIDHRNLCKKDLEQIWNKLLAKRDANDEYLRNKQKGNDPATPDGNWKQATAQTLQNRVNNPGWYRGCKCGREIVRDPTSVDEVYLCLGCDGWRSVHNPAATRHQPFASTALLRRELNKYLMYKIPSS